MNVLYFVYCNMHLLEYLSCILCQFHTCAYWILTISPPKCRAHCMCMHAHSSVESQYVLCYSVSGLFVSLADLNLCRPDCLELIEIRQPKVLTLEFLP